MRAHQKSSSWHSHPMRQIERLIRENVWERACGGVPTTSAAAMTSRDIKNLTGLVTTKKEKPPKETAKAKASGDETIGKSARYCRIPSFSISGSSAGRALSTKDGKRRGSLFSATNPVTSSVANRLPHSINSDFCTWFDSGWIRTTVFRLDTRPRKAFRIVTSAGSDVPIDRRSSSKLR